MSDEEKRILIDMPEAAEYRTDIKGWVSRDGFFFGDDKDAEHNARYKGCTHLYCQDCKTPIPKIGYSVCDRCRAIRVEKRYFERDLIDYDDGYIYSIAHDRYFSDSDELHDYIYDNFEQKPSLDELLLVPCGPIYLRPVEYDYWYDDMPDESDGDDLPKEVIDALDHLNTVLSKQDPISWYPSITMRINIP